MDEASQRIAALIRSGKKLEAVKLLSESTGCSLQEAIAQVDQLSAELSGAGAEAPLSPQIEALARQGRKIEAIKLLREETGVGLKEAKERIDRAAGPAGQGKGCLTVLVLAGVVLTAGLLFVV